MRRPTTAVASLFFLAAFTLVACAGAKLRGGVGRPEAPRVDFHSDIQPIFAAHCYECHGAAKSRSELRLDRKALALKGGASGPVIVPGNSEASLVVRRLLGLDGEDSMPFERDRLAPPQIALIRAWIDQGAHWPDEPIAPAAPSGEAGPTAKHWAYVKPVRPVLPAVTHETWVRNPIDRFALARLEREGLSPSPEADRAALVRRAYFDLIGLPPSVEEVDAFLADDRPDAYERLVEGLLASPHYGERWARPWLDLARYADSNGFEKDRLRVMWKYRDWVINALNEDMPFDRFTIAQIAGDMLPEPTDDDRVASGFHRNTMLNQEGGIDVEEARWETLVDRVNTTATVWLGTTLACAQCHDHKYDPFTQKEYYRLLAFFDNVEYTVGGQSGGDRFIEEPKTDLPTPEQKAKRDELGAAIEKLEREIASAKLDAAQAAWEQRMRAAERAWTTLRPVSAHSTAQATLTLLEDSSILASGRHEPEDEYVVTARLPISGITAIQLEALPDPRLPRGGPGRDFYGNFRLHGFELETAAAGRPTRRRSASASATASADSPKPGEGESPRLAGGLAEAAEWRRLKIEAARVDSATAAVDLRSFRGMTAAGGVYDDSPGWAIDATRDDPRFSRRAVFTLASPLGGPAGTTLRITLRHHNDIVAQSLGRFRLSVTASRRSERNVRLPARLRPVLHTAADLRSEQQGKDLAAHYRSIAPSLARTRERLQALRKELGALGIAAALVMRERPSHERPSTWLRRRGSFTDKAERVYAGVPAVLHPLPDTAMPNRLGLAKWLVSPENPLVARVAVNRAWEQVFGRGLVETSEDFGIQGERTSHPDLLDWLAVQFMEGGWRMKPLHRLIVTSAIYRQSSTMTPALVERDPYNRLLARGPRFRVEAETVRDAALAASGLLSPRVGGPSVYPPQPDGIWQNPYDDSKYVTSVGEDRYRRGLYAIVRRTAPHPMLTTFDAPAREVCTVRRPRTNTPLQALTLLNDEAFFETARALAGRALAEAGAEPRARATRMFRLCVTRPPRADELDRILRSYERQRERFLKNPRAAADVAGPAPGEDASERAAWTMVANALLNLDETVTKQ
jgi:cytochrome c553